MMLPWLATVGGIAMLLQYNWNMAAALQFNQLPQNQFNPEIILAGKAPVKQAHPASFADISIKGGIVDWEGRLKISLAPSFEPSAKSQHSVPSYTSPHQKLSIRGPNGKDYECYLPEESASSRDSASLELPATEEAPASSQPIAEAENARLEQAKRYVESMKKTCLYLTSGFWIYEFCPTKYVRQYHGENSSTKKASISAIFPDGVPILSGDALTAVLNTVLDKTQQNQVITQDYLLGRYIPGTENTEEIVNGRFVQSYSDGDVCFSSDGSTVVRKAAVRYECNAENTFDRIMEVTEVSFCSYTIRIGSPSLCLILNSPSRDASMPADASLIDCFPVGNHSNTADPFKNGEPARKETEEVSPTLGSSPAPTGELSKSHRHGRHHSPRTHLQSPANLPDTKNLFWKQLLREFLKGSSSSKDFPVIRKALLEYIEDEQILISADDEQPLPDNLVKKWLQLLGVAEESREGEEEQPPLTEQANDSHVEL